VIYEFPTPDVPIRQGDIFRGIPKAALSLTEVSILTEQNEPEAARWDDLSDRNEPIAAVVGLTPVMAIVITQDCDTIRAPEISFCEIRPIFDVVKLSTPPKTPTKWVDFLRRHAVQNLKWFYLPPDGQVGFADRMAVDFQSVLRVPRDELEQLRNLRTGRLNTVADEHFRERLAEFFRRYPYNEWYPFSKIEFEAYRAMSSDEAENITPYEHQK